MKVSDCMTRKVHLASPSQTIQDAARIMAEIDAGALPVGDDDHLVGVITDRDIAVRAIGAGKSLDTPVREVMSREIKYCFEDETLEDVLQNMGDIQVRRLPVLDRSKRLVGIVALADLANSGQKPKVLGETLGNVSRAGGRHSQSHANGSAAPRH
jgi:CBS domain-containing protein